MRSWPSTACLALALLAGLGACQPPPRPFASGERTSLLDMPESLGVAVTAVDGVPAPLGDALRDAMVDALHKHNLPATPVYGNRGSFRLAAVGQFEPGAADRSTLHLAWDLADWSGRPIGRVEHSMEARPQDWLRYTRRELASVTDGAAARLAEIVHATNEAGVTTMVRPPEPPALRIAAIEGAPGDGGPALAKALAAALEARGLRVAGTEAAAGSLTVTGTASVTPAGRGQDRIELVWRLLASDGAELGKIDQANAVPAGRLDGPWGEIAELAADGAATGIAQLLEQVGPRLPGRRGESVYTPPPR